MSCWGNMNDPIPRQPSPVYNDFQPPQESNLPHQIENSAEPMHRESSRKRIYPSYSKSRPPKKSESRHVESEPSQPLADDPGDLNFDADDDVIMVEYRTPVNPKSTLSLTQASTHNFEWRAERYRTLKAQRSSYRKALFERPSQQQLKARRMSNMEQVKTSQVIEIEDRDDTKEEILGMLYDMATAMEMPQVALLADVRFFEFILIGRDSQSAGEGNLAERPQS